MLGRLFAAIMLSMAPASWAAAQENDRPYDGTLEGFHIFVADHHKHWPDPTEMATFKASDGKGIRYAHWSPQDTVNHAGTIVFFQGRTEFIEKNIYLYVDMISRGYDLWTLDWRGQGFSERLLPDSEGEKGYVDSFDSYVHDAEQFIEERVPPKQEKKPRILIAHSMGGGVATLYLERHPDQFDKAILTSPLIRLPEENVPSYVRPLNWIKTAIGWGAWCVHGQDCTWRSAFRTDRNPCVLDGQAELGDLNDPIAAQRYSHDLGKLTEIECWIRSSRAGSPADRNLGLGGVASAWLRAAFVATDAIDADKHEIRTPLLIVGAGGEGQPSGAVVSNVGQKTFCAAIHDMCCRVEIENSGHEILIEDDKYRARFLELFDQFVSLDPADPKQFCATHSQIVSTRQ